jgi:hypothetical protein
MTTVSQSIGAIGIVTSRELLDLSSRVSGDLHNLAGSLA